MTRIAQWLGGSMVVSVVLGPAAAAQTVKPTDLVGTWVETHWSVEQPDSQYVEETIWTFHADSTWTVRGRRNGIEDTSFHGRPANSFVIDERIGHWRVVGDTFRFLSIHAMGGSPRDSSDIPLRVIRQGDRIIWTNTSYADFACYADTLHHIDPSKPLPPPSTTLRPLTVDRTALIGAWVLTQPKQLQGRSFVDTIMLTLRTDSTVSETMGWWSYGGQDARGNGVFGYERTKSNGRWGLFPGDILAMNYPDAKGVFHGFSSGVWSSGKVALQDNQLIFDGCHYADQTARVYKRVSP